MGKAQVGATITATTLAVALSAPFDRHTGRHGRRRRLIVLATLCLVVPTALIGFSSGLESLLVLRFLQGLCLPAIFSVTIVFITEGGRPVATQGILRLYMAGSNVGGFLGRFVVAGADQYLGWRDGFSSWRRSTCCSRQ